MAVEIWFLRKMLWISWTEKKSSVEVMTAAGVCRCVIRQWQLNFLGHVMRQHGLENLAVTVKVDGRRARDAKE